MSKIVARRICWPNPDATCLEGGCGYCNFEKFRALSTIEAYARKAGKVYHRGGRQVDAWDAYTSGYGYGFYNAETKEED
ncbi:hypothetical protein SEA_EXIGUO_84 [Gordonia phage Exiguo]|uniref:Uncharacterized protein n=2 Tax=Montyvirus TaxID=2733196 RepID=A0A2K9VDQ1_9CAUD|nr:hypothetical protein BJD64_gp046 [Gordonia phage Hotorobo]YP_009797928.1 hypothetical protein HOS74_gp046 [Gordonia phage Flakey]QAY16905.1 hypothetical protein SEA_EXIGUO_84 [Gordonia phage Exiguo]QOP64530.1 hypothetical protein SEA_SAM12_84 [Gordonia phage Sam12]AMS02379.1 hypothetical protein SEA_HOTOROBO_87 [Gordonia phage Hotorobo]AUV60381.1 hypothetical protein SEA_FLAKEY_86 [Gordonia phage Flakey]